MEIKDLKLIFMGTPAISAYVFEKMVLAGYHFVALIAQPDKNKNKKGILEKVPTKIIAEKYNIPVYQPLKIRKEYEFIKELNPDIIITLAYGQIVPQGLLDIPPLGCLNLHGSLLPKYRGASPIQTSLINNDKITGMTLMAMSKDMDAGNIYAKKEVIIDEDDNNTSLFNKMALAAESLILESLPLYINGQLKGVEQDINQVSYCSTIKPEQEHLNLNLSASHINGWIKALSDVPGGYLYLDNLKIKIFKAQVIEENYCGDVGEIVKADKKGLYIKCLDKTLSILELQKEGKKRMSYKDFINGFLNIKGKKFN